MSNTKKDTAIESQDLQNDHVKILLEKHPGCQVVIHVDVVPNATEAAYQKAIKAINKEVSLPGFRKGKAPTDIILQRYSSHVDQEWKEILVQTAFKEAVNLSQVYPLSQEMIKKPELKHASKDKGASIIFSFESTPNIPNIDPKDLTLKSVEKKAVTQDDIETAMENLRLHHAEWEEVEGAIEEGHYIDVDIENADKPGDFICQNTRFEVADKKMGDWMRKLVVGKHVNETVEGMSERSEEMDQAAPFVPTHCKITINSIKSAKLPSIDDALAKKVGAASVSELKERIEKSLELQSEGAIREELRQQLDHILAEKYAFDVPSSLIHSELKNRIDYAKRELHKAGKSDQEIADKIENLRESLEQEVLRAFRLFFISRRVADENQITVSQGELVKELMMQLYSQTSPMDSAMDTEEARSKIYVSLLSKKVKDFLIDRATIQ